MSIEVGRNNDHNVTVCPICGKPDWCNTSSDKDGHIFITCKRVIDGANILSQHDGMYYVYIGESKKDSHSKYEEANQRAARKGLSYDKKTFDITAKIKLVEPKEMVQALSEKKLDLIYTTLLDALVLEPYHEAYLLSEGWTKEMIKNSGVKSFPASDYQRKRDGLTYKNLLRWQLASILVERYKDLTGVPGAYVAKGRSGREYWTFAGKAGILFPIKNILGQTYRLRVRIDEKEAKGKYRNFSSYVLDRDTGENVYKNGCQANNAVGCYVKPFFQEADWYMVDVVEGEKKAFVVSEILKTPSFSLPGTGSYAMFLEYCGYLLSKGTKVILLDFDADKHTNKHVSAHESELAKKLATMGFIVGSREWNMEDGKGIDDCLLSGHRTSVKTF